MKRGLNIIFLWFQFLHQDFFCLRTAAVRLLLERFNNRSANSRPQIYASVHNLIVMKLKVCVLQCLIATVFWCNRANHVASVIS